MPAILTSVASVTSVVHRPCARFAMFSYLKRSSKAWRALVGPGVPVCRSTVVRGAKNAHSFLMSLGVTRTEIVCAHSKRALVSKDTH